MLQEVSSLIKDNAGTITTIVFAVLVLTFLFVAHRASRRDLEKFYKKYPKYDPRKNGGSNAYWL